MGVCFGPEEKLCGPIAPFLQAFYWRGQDLRYLSWNFIQKQMTETEPWLKKVRLIRNWRHLTFQIQSFSLFHFWTLAFQLGLQPACQLHNFWKGPSVDSTVLGSKFPCSVRSSMWALSSSTQVRSVTDPALIDRFSTLTFFHHQKAFWPSVWR